MILYIRFFQILFVLPSLIFSMVIDWLRIAYHKFSEFPIAYTSLLYLFITMAFCHYPIFDHWVTGFIMMSLPLAIIFGLGGSSYLLYKNQKMVATIGFIWVLLAFPIIKRLVGINQNTEQITSLNTLKVLSFNGECFAENNEGNNKWAVLKSDIACFQEYSPNQNVEIQFKNKIEKLTEFDECRSVGLALFSQYPIVNQYSKIWDKAYGPKINGFICADIAYGNDTVRVVNAHLWSMGVRINQSIDALKNGEFKQFAFEIVDTFQKMKEGFEYRNDQLKEIESYVSGSKYPVIICGDFNETPFGYAYGKLSLSFKNAFEEVGKGLGFTLNRQPYCVRIDQQFFSSEWQVQSCYTMSDINMSDHFPVMAEYVLKKPNKSTNNILASIL
ncbi:endonuclease/exonuclease/phosphatase family protein [Arcicella sp. DC2W]|uniref:Endonuclease/exonuclease/phosphatase family protein n=1 Tax=Arcicella gelida TaxID=2984195 RepID=A0ABU5RYS7_9BACT|nr:endonuclease/exonuclease/phosphatase family protein [Arcicella sp. DC2W]MEA5401342.1 endonuclease/exonuclease/phosphatase family protein [Arcicella sp. DC2W]